MESRREDLEADDESGSLMKSSSITCMSSKLLNLRKERPLGVRAASWGRAGNERRGRTKRGEIRAMYGRTGFL